MESTTISYENRQSSIRLSDVIHSQTSVWVSGLRVGQDRVGHGRVGQDRIKWDSAGRGRIAQVVTCWGIF